MTRSGAIAALTLLSMSLACRAAAPGPPSPAPAAAPAAGAAPSTLTLDAAAVKQAGIVTEPARTITRSEVTEAPGVIALDETRTARIGSLVDGNVVQTIAEVGARVPAGRVLAQLHSHLVHDAWAGYRKAIAERRRLTTELTFAHDAEARATRLYADKAVALQDVQRAQANRVAAEENLDQAKTEVRRSEEELEHLGITNGEDPTGESGEQIPVKTPIAGVVLERLITQGTAVTPGMPLFVVSDLARLWVLAEIDEARLSRVKVGRPVQVRVAAYPDERFDGTVSFVGETVNPKTRRVTVRGELSNPDGRLKPEMFATVVLGESEPRPTLVVPSSALQTVDGHPVVFVAEAPTRFAARPVELGPEASGMVEIKSGIAAGETVVTKGSFVLKSELLKSATGPES